MLTLGWTSAVSQSRYVISATQEMKISGGSTLHDWHMETKAVKGEGMFKVAGGQFKGAQSLAITFDAESLKSGTKGLDSNAYKALKTDKNKQISYLLTELTGSGPTFTAKGNLTIAGVTKPISFPVKLTTTGNQLTFEGSLKTQLTYFSITPPTALMGTVKTEDAVTLSFKTTFQPSL